jgi:hypothetical protein
MNAVDNTGGAVVRLATLRASRAFCDFGVNAVFPAESRTRSGMLVPNEA